MERVRNFSKEELLRHYLTAELDPQINPREYYKRHIPENLYWKNQYGEEHNVRELLLTESNYSTELIVETMSDVIIEGAQSMVCAREASNTVTGVRNPFKFPLGAAFGYAEIVSEGAQFPMNNQDYDYKQFEAQKIAWDAPITQEMVEDCTIDLIMQEIKYAGKAIEAKLNRLWLTDALDNAGLEHDTAGSNQGIKAVINAKGLMKAAGFVPDTLVMHPHAEAMVMADYATAYTPQWAEAIRTGTLPDVVGLKPYVLNVAEDSTSYTWEYNSDGDIGMLVLDKAHGMGCVIFKDITVNRFEDPTRDLVHLPVRMRADVGYLHANAICRIEY